MGKGLTATLCLVALLFGPAGVRSEEAFSLRGQWQPSASHLPAYVGVVLIDAEHRVTWDSPQDSGRPAKYKGYVAKIDGTRVDIALTDRAAVVHMNCKIQSSDLLHCVSLFRDGAVSPPYVLTRIGPGPKNLMSALP